jgi:hypothetical protein
MTPKLEPAAASEPPWFMEPTTFQRSQEWQFEELHRAPSVVETQIAQRVTGTSSRATLRDDYMCMAREMAAYIVEHRSYPDELLQRWIGGRCGTPTVVSWSQTHWIYARGVLDAPLNDELLDRVVQSLPVDKVPDARFFGIGARAKGSEAVVVLMEGNPSADLHMRGPDANGEVHLEGKLLESYLHLRAIINQGSVATQECRNESNEALPKFAFSCNMGSNDDQAWIELSGRVQDDASEYTVAQALAVKPQAPSTYRNPARPLPKADEPAEALIEAINTYRVAAHVPPLKYSEEQSRLLQEEYPKLFEIQTSLGAVSDSPVRERALQGQRIKGVIEHAEMEMLLTYAGDAHDWLASMMSLPSTRGLLMDPMGNVIALGTFEGRPIGFSGAVAVYTVREGRKRR